MIETKEIAISASATLVDQIPGRKGKFKNGWELWGSIPIFPATCPG